jgi:DNA polymerase III epsilon subunit-like protein
VTVNNNACTVLYNKVIKHRLQDGQRIDHATARSGITEADYHNGIPYEEAIVEVKDILKDAIVVGHNIRCDFRALQLPMYPTVHCVYDTATNVSLNALVPSERGKPQSKLAGLALSLLGDTIQRHTVHDPVEDALASLRIYLNLRWEPLGDPHSLATLQDGRTFRLE